MSNHDTTETFGGSESPASSDSWIHPLNVGHLVMGIAFAGMVLVWALVASEVASEDDLAWLMPIPWVSAGAAGLVAMALGARRRR